MQDQPPFNREQYPQQPPFNQGQQPYSSPSQQPYYQGQPPYPQQPQYYPPQQQPPIQPQNKKPWYRSPIGCVLAIVVLLACGLIGIISTAHGTPSSTPDTANITQTQSVNNPTTASQKTVLTHTLAWKTTHTFSGNGSKKTGTFTVGDDWKILYSCTYQSIGGITADGALAVSVYNSDATIADPAAINATCSAKTKNTTGETEEHQAEQVYLDIASTGSWTITIQELK